MGQAPFAYQGAVALVGIHTVGPQYLRNGNWRGLGLVITSSASKSVWMVTAEKGGLESRNCVFETRWLVQC